MIWGKILLKLFSSPCLVFCCVCKTMRCNKSVKEGNQVLFYRKSPKVLLLLPVSNNATPFNYEDDEDNNIFWRKLYRNTFITLWKKMFKRQKSAILIRKNLISPNYHETRQKKIKIFFIVVLLTQMCCTRWLICVLVVLVIILYAYFFPSLFHAIRLVEKSDK